MTVDTIRMKYLGQRMTFYRVMDADGEPVRVFETLAEAQAYVAQSKV